MPLVKVSQRKPLLLRYLSQELAVEGTGVFLPLPSSLLRNFPEKPVAPGELLHRRRVVRHRPDN